MPLVWWISRLCEEFGCLPSQAMREWLTAPDGLLEEIVEMRAYVKARRNYETAQGMDDGPAKRKVLADPLVQMVMAHEFADVIARQQQATETDG